MDATDGRDPDLPTSAAVLRVGLAMSDLDVTTFHADYVALGGTLKAYEVRAVLRGQALASAAEHDRMAQALNNDFTGRGQDHPVPYAEDLEDVDRDGLAPPVRREEQPE